VPPLKGLEISSLSPSHPSRGGLNNGAPAGLVVVLSLVIRIRFTVPRIAITCDTDQRHDRRPTNQRMRITRSCVRQRPPGVGDTPRVRKASKPRFTGARLLSPGRKPWVDVIKEGAPEAGPRHARLSRAGVGRGGTLSEDASVIRRRRNEKRAHDIKAGLCNSSLRS
jgi:hypothetical protein